MQQMDLTYFCRTIGSLCGFPVRLFEGETEMFKADHSGLRYDPLLPYKADLFALSTHVGTYIGLLT